MTHQDVLKELLAYLEEGRLEQVENVDVTKMDEYSNAMCRWDRRILALKVAIDTCAAVRGGH